MTEADNSRVILATETDVEAQPILGSQDMPLKVEVSGGDGVGEEDMMCLEDFMDVITTFKCRACDYKSNERDRFLEHVSNSHIVASEPESAPTIEEEPVESEGILRSVDNDDVISEEIAENEGIPETLEGVFMEAHPEPDGQQILVQTKGREMFVCGSCSACFASSELCKQHMDK